MSSRRTTLFVAGFGHDLRARDLAYEFERYGRLVRCDIPAPKSSSAKVGYAFVEFEDDRDAEDAYYDMHGRKVDGYQLTVQWAKNAPSSNWRYEAGKDGGRPPRDGGRGGDRRRSPSPVRGGRGGDRGDFRGRDERDARRSASPARRDGDSGARGRSASPAAPAAAAEDSSSRYREEGSPSAANGAGREERSPSPQS